MAVNNTLRAIAIIAVLGIHVLAAQSQFLQQNGLPIPDYFLNLNLFFRFCVPLFVALSGFGLAKSFNSRVSGMRGLPGLRDLLSDYFVRRVLRLLPWYLFWGMTIYLYINFIGQGSATYGQVPLWKLFVFGKIDYHFYFVPMIVKLYLFFPLLFWLVKKFPWPILTIAFLWQIYQYWGFNATLLSDQQQYVQAASWLFYFTLGIFLASQDHLLQKKWLSAGFVVLTIIGLIWSLISAQNLQSLGSDPIIFTRFTQVPVLFYATGFILAALSVLPKLLARLPHYPAALLLSLGELSYLVYLNHTLILRVLTRPPFATSAWPFPLLLLTEVIVSTFVAKVVHGAFSRLWREGQLLIHRKS